MTIINDCQCVGPICTCSGREVVKDGATIRVPLFMKDSAAASPPWTMSLADRAASSKYDNVRGMMCGGIPAEQYFAALDAANEDPSAQRALAARDMAQDAYERRVANAWRSDGARPPTPAYSDAGAAARAAQEAYERHISNAWRS